MSDTGQVDQNSEQYKTYQASLPQDLESQIVDSRIPKNEREWWACAEIHRLRDCLAVHEADKELIRLRSQLAESRARVKNIESWLMESGRLAGRTIPLHPDPQIRRITLECCGPAEAKNNIETLCHYFKAAEALSEKLEEVAEISISVLMKAQDYLERGGANEDLTTSTVLITQTINGLKAALTLMRGSGEKEKI